MTNPMGRNLDPKTAFAVERFKAELALDPNDPYAYDRMGLWWHWKRQYSEALALYNKAILLDPQLAHALCARASLLATCPDARYRDGPMAVVDATAALRIAKERNKLGSDWEHRMYLQTLAAAYAEAGDFQSAAATQREALPFSMTRRARSEVTARLAQYALKQPTREAAGLVHYGTSRESDA
jgi:tetratricopeptide (TPR) repeat protein